MRNLETPFDQIRAIIQSLELEIERLKAENEQAWLVASGLYKRFDRISHKGRMGFIVRVDQSTGTVDLEYFKYNKQVTGIPITEIELV